MLTTTSPDSTILRAGGFAALGMSICYITMYVIFIGGWISVPAGANPIAVIQYIQERYLLVMTTYSIGYLLFGVLLAILLQALQRALPSQQSAMAGLADRFGGIWVMLMMATGMTYLIGLDKTIHLLSSDTEQAQSLYQTVRLIGGALGGEIELVGGLWVLLLSIAGLNQKRLPKPLHVLGLIIGALGVMTLLHTIPSLKDAFGALQILWFTWLGAALLQSAKFESSVSGPALKARS